MNQFKNTSFDKWAKKGYNYYLNRFFGLKCAVKLLECELFPNAKEITESFAAFEATKYLPFDWGNSQINIVCVGDGVKPRTAATFALRTKWNCYSIDPMLRDRTYDIKRLTLIPKKVEHVLLTFDTPTIICCVHSHAKLSACLKSITAPITNIINIPCCVKPDIGIPCISYNDSQVWSEKNLVEIYK